MENQFKKKTDERLESQIEVFGVKLRPRIKMPKENWGEELTKSEPSIEKNFSIEEIIKDMKMRVINVEKTFWGEYYTELQEQADILKYSHDLASIKDLYNLPEDLNQDLKNIIEKYRDKYLNFLRKEKSLETELREVYKNIYEEYFKSITKEIKEKITNLEKQKVGECGCISIRERSSIFKINFENEELILKVFTKLPYREVQIMLPEIEAQMRALNVNHVSHMYGYSYEDGVIVMSMVPGKSMSESEEKNDYSDEELIEFLEIFQSLWQRGIDVDTDDTNILYDKKHGFSIIDYHLPNSNSVSYGLQLKGTSENILSHLSKYSNKIDPQFNEMAKRIIGLVEKNFPEIKKMAGKEFEEWKEI